MTRALRGVFEGAAGVIWLACLAPTLPSQSVAVLEFLDSAAAASEEEGSATPQAEASPEAGTGLVAWRRSLPITVVEREARLRQLLPHLESWLEKGGADPAEERAFWARVNEDRRDTGILERPWQVPSVLADLGVAPKDDIA